MDKQLQEKWAKKLADSGFVDIENPDGSLKQEIHSRTISFALLQKDVRETYYEMAEDFLRSHPFKDKLERAVWEDHCAGYSIRDSVNKYKQTRYRIHKIIRALQKLAKLSEHKK